MHSSEDPCLACDVLGHRLGILKFNCLHCAGTERRPVVEFALENAQALKKRALRQTKVQEQSVGKTRTARGASEVQEAGEASPKQPRKRKREDSEVNFLRADRSLNLAYCMMLARCLRPIALCPVLSLQTSLEDSQGTGANTPTEHMAHLQAPRKAARERTEGQVPKEGRGQRQRRKKREGSGAGGQPDQTFGQLAEQPAQTGTARGKGPGRQKTANASSAGTDRVQEAAGQKPVARKLQAMSSDAGILQALHLLCLGNWRQ